MEEFCVAYLFYGGESLTAAPALPAATLAVGCYEAMVCGCKSLTQAPELPTTTLAAQCYYFMFYNCKGLNKVTCLATDISASGATEDWLSGVAATGTFTKAEGVEGWTTGASGIPEGWTVEDYKQAATVTKAPTAKNLTYNGQTQALVEASKAEDGEMQYVLGTATTAPTSSWSASIPTASEAGTKITTRYGARMMKAAHVAPKTARFLRITA